MDPIYFLPESKHCYDLINEDVSITGDNEPSISIETIDASTDPDTLGNFFLSNCENGNLANVQRLLDIKEALINFRDTDGYTGLHRASYNGHIETIDCLINCGADLFAQTNDGWQPLHCACRWNQADAAFLLLQKGVDINCQTAGKQTPLHLAATTPDHAKTLEMLLLDKRINPSLRNGANETAYEIAKRSGPHHQLFELVDPSI